MQSIDAFVQPTAAALVYVGPAVDLETAVRPLMIGGRIVTAVGRHPALDDVYYFTTDHPDALRLFVGETVELLE